MKNKTDVKGGPALDALFKMLFKGIDNIMGYAAEYENDMGVLKQVTKIPVTGKDGNKYEITIKLAPIKDKEDTFYVEIDDGGCPGLDFSKYNEKPMKIDKKNKEEFNKLIRQVLNDAGVKRASSATGGGVEEDTIDCYDKYEYDTWRWENDQKGQRPKVIKVEVTIAKSADDPKLVDINMECSDRELKLSDDRLLQDHLLGADPDKVDDIIDDVLRSSKLVPVKNVDDLTRPDEEEAAAEDMQMEEGTPASSHVDVSLSYIKSSDEVNLSAIYANYDVGQAMEALQQVIDDDAFVATLTEEPQSFRITDEGDDFDIAIIDEVDVSNSANDIYTAICALSGMLDAYSINLDERQQAAASTLLNSLEEAKSVFTPTDQLDPL